MVNINRLMRNVYAWFCFLSGYIGVGQAIVAEQICFYFRRSKNQKIAAIDMKE